MRTFEEIVNYYEEKKATDFFGTYAGDLLGYLPYKYVQKYLKPECTETEWIPLEYTEETVKKEMIDYMEFAWEKANRCRGISASRSMEHYTAWIWLLGDDAVSRFGDLQSYNYYGKDNLIRICDFLGLDHKQWDDGERVN